jgi:predicted lipid-binding transport protein (Tim44 family)
MVAHRKLSTLVFAALLGLGLGTELATDADARAGSGASAGSRGGRSFSAPPATQTAPRGAAPLERSTAQPGQSSFGNATQAQRGGLFSGGFGSGLMGGLAGGLLGAGLFGLFTGHGLFGGMSGLSSILGLVLQLGLLYLLFRLVMGFIRSRRPATQGAAFDSGRSERGLFGGLVGGRPQNGGLGGFGGFGGGGAAVAPQSRRLDVTAADFSTFEERLAAVQAAYGREDRSALASLATAEMARYFADEFAANASKGLRNAVADVRFLQGDLSEAWREGAADYATVAMRFSVIDTMVDRTSGALVSGDPTTPQEVTELWTFTRRGGGTARDWVLSAIQQA